MKSESLLIGMGFGGLRRRVIRHGRHSDASTLDEGVEVGILFVGKKTRQKRITIRGELVPEEIPITCTVDCTT